MKDPVKYFEELGLKDLAEQVKDLNISADELIALAGEDLRSLFSIKECLAVKRYQKVANDSPTLQSPTPFHPVSLIRVPPQSMSDPSVKMSLLDGRS